MSGALIPDSEGLAQPGRVTILTSEVEDIRMLTAEHPRVTAEKI